MKIAFVIYQVQYSIPLGVAYCAAMVKRAGFECQVFAIDVNTNQTRQEISENPRGVNFSPTGFISRRSRAERENNILQLL
jgi:hypothetical protein